MNYKDYKISSERHFETCLRLKEIIILNFPTNGELNPNEIKKRNEILANLYYLSGYVLECIIHFAIVEYVIEMDTDFRKKVSKRKKCSVEDVSVRDMEVGDNNSNVGYNKGGYVLYHDGHKFQKNIQFFNDGSKISGIDSIRGINGRPIPQMNIRELFFKWNAQVRYSTQDFEKYLTPTDMLGFLDFVEEVYEGINYKILPNYAKSN